MRTGSAKCEVRSAMICAVWMLMIAGFRSWAVAQEKLPTLRPPLEEIPPSFWEQHGTMVVVWIIVGLLAIALGIWSWLRPKPITPVPPQVQARKALEVLLHQPEDGALVSRVSQILRRYVLAVFELPAGEPTTTEFCQLIVGHERIGGELSDALTKFLRDCDERKFAHSNSSTPLGAAARALELVALNETRRAHLCQLEADQATQAAGAST